MGNPNRALWSLNKTNEVEYVVIKTLEIHSERKNKVSALHEKRFLYLLARKHNYYLLCSEIKQILAKQK